MTKMSLHVRRQSGPASSESTTTSTPQPLSWNRIFSAKILVIGSLLITGMASVQLMQLVRVPSRHMNQAHFLKEYPDIIKNIYENTFAHLQKCPRNITLHTCIQRTQKLLREDDTAPWWFHTMLRDASSMISRQGNPFMSAPTPNGIGLQFCSMGKVGSKQWREVLCQLQNKTSKHEHQWCKPETPVDNKAPKVVFLRDPLERYLSAYIDKCVSWRRKTEPHCEPLPVFVDEENGLTEGLNNSKKLMFETYVNTMPLKWNMHFFPQSLSCGGLYHNLASFDFVGKMGKTFNRDLGDMGKRYGVTKELQSVFQFQQKQTTSNEGIENSASSHVLEYYTPQTVRKVLEYLAMDYVMLNMTIPEWAVQMSTMTTK